MSKFIIIRKLYRIVLLFIFCTCAISNFTEGQVAVSQDFYVVDGQRVSLQLSDSYSAFKLKDNISPATVSTFGANIDTSSFGTIESSGILNNHDIILVKHNSGVSANSAQGSVQILNSTPEVEVDNPVYAIGGIDQVLINEFIIQYSEDVSSASVQASLSESNATVIRTYEHTPNRFLIRFNNQTAREGLSNANQMIVADIVEWCEPNFIRIMPNRPRVSPPGNQGMGSSNVAPAASPGDNFYGQQYALNNTGSVGNADADIDAQEAWDIEKGSADVIVAILDEGVQTSHPDLAAKIVTPYDATDGDNNQEPNSWDGHGTACAGIAAAVTGTPEGIAGVGWNVKILPVRIAYSSSPQSTGWITSNAIIEDALRVAVDRGANVLSNSWGGGSPSSLINSAIDYALNNNRTVVFAAGNDNSAVSYPAKLSLTKNIICVSATNEWDESKTPTSSDGESWWGTSFGPEVNVAAPGVHIYTTDITGGGGYASGNYTPNFNGTSSATPFVAGAAALLISQNPAMTPSQVRTQIQNTADDKGPGGFDNRFGHGRLNVCKALGGSSSTCDSNPPPSCTSLGAVVSISDQGASQILFNIALLCSSMILLILIFGIYSLRRFYIVQ